MSLNKHAGEYFLKTHGSLGAGVEPNVSSFKFTLERLIEFFPSLEEDWTGKGGRGKFAINA
jgi:hypothetical protein